MGLILIAVWVLLTGFFALISVNIPHWPMAILAIVAGAVTLFQKIRGK